MGKKSKEAKERASSKTPQKETNPPPPPLSYSRTFALLAVFVVLFGAVGGALFFYTASRAESNLTTLKQRQNALVSAGKFDFLHEPDSDALTPEKRDAMLHDVVDHFFHDLTYRQLHPKTIRDAFDNPIWNLKSTCIYVSVANNELEIEYYFDFKRYKRTRSALALLRSLTKTYKVPDIQFLIMVNDGNRPRVPLFGAARHWTAKEWTGFLPIPLGNDRGRSEGYATTFTGWDDYVRAVITKTHTRFPWEEKIPKAVFRGGFSMQTHELGSCNGGNLRRCVRATEWRRVNRGVLYSVTSSAPELFDVNFTSKQARDDAIIHDVPVGHPIPFIDFQNFKYIISIGANQDWTERLRNLLFMNSVVFKHDAESEEWFYPLLKPFVHYVPFDVMIGDLPEKVQWARAHDLEARRIVRNANQFAAEFLNEEVMMRYTLFALQRYWVLQEQAKFCASTFFAKFVICPLTSVVKK